MIHGHFRDEMRDASGRTLWTREWQHNVIVADCHRLLAAFLHGAPTNTKGIVGLSVGAGLEVWDAPPGLPVADPSQTKLVDPFPFVVPRTSLAFTYLNGAVASVQPTSKLQIVATLGPLVPNWPGDGHHASSILREFGLVAQLDTGVNVLINYRNHPAIDKDPTSTLERSIWLQL